MPRLRSAAYLAAAVMMLSVTACAPEPWVLSHSANGLTLRWYADTSSEAQARGVARAYCTETGKSLELGDLEEDGSAMIAHYRCV
jgi:hypothetical protein